MLKDALIRARQLHQKRKYGLALEILKSNMKLTRKKSSKSIEDLSQEELYSTFDLRADLLVREGQLEEALEDANVMIRMQSSNPRGYLRLGQALLLLGRPKEAAETYRRAIKRVPPEEDCYKMLLVLEKKARNRYRELSVPRSDPLTRLPRELLYIIFSQLSLQERLQITRVSKKWREYIRNEPKFWSSIRLKLDAPLKISSETLISYISLSALPLRLDLREAALRRPEKLVKHICHNCRVRAVSLEFDMSLSTIEQPLAAVIRSVNKPLPNLVNLCIPSDCVDADIAWCLANLPSLETLELRGVAHGKAPTLSVVDTARTKLKSLKLLGTPQTPPILAPFAAALASIPSLEVFWAHAILADFECLSPLWDNANLKDFGFTTQALRPLRIMMPQFKSDLERLALNKVEIDLGSHTMSLPLKYLELKWTTLRANTLSDLLTRLKCDSSLETLVVHRGNFQWPLAGQDLVFPRLTTLQFSEMPALDSESLAWLLNAIRYVKKVNVDYTQFNGLVLMKLIQLGITHLRCKECPMSYEFVEWLQNGNKGQVKVTY